MSSNNNSNSNSNSNSSRGKIGGHSSSSSASSSKIVTGGGNSSNNGNNRNIRDYNHMMNEDTEATGMLIEDDESLCMKHLAILSAEPSLGRLYLDSDINWLGRAIAERNSVIAETIEQIEGLKTSLRYLDRILVNSKDLRMHNHIYLAVTAAERSMKDMVKFAKKRVVVGREEVTALRKQKDRAVRLMAIARKPSKPYLSTTNIS